jgi:predicted RNase H-like nuclease (RuvC/YqgF family)
MSNTIRLLLIGVVCLLAASIAVAHRGNTPPGAEAPAAQDVMNLDRRISTLEQRLYSLESSINQLRQQAAAQRPSPSVSGIRDPEVDRLRSEILLLEQRIREVECGVVKLDERTLSPSARESRRSERQGADPCRIRPETPLQLSSRPR